jgi:hypothetical protein
MDVLASQSRYLARDGKRREHDDYVSASHLCHGTARQETRKPTNEGWSRGLGASQGRNETVTACLCRLVLFLVPAAAESVCRLPGSAGLHGLSWAHLLGVPVHGSVLYLNAQSISQQIVSLMWLKGGRGKRQGTLPFSTLFCLVDATLLHLQYRACGAAGSVLSSVPSAGGCAALGLNMNRMDIGALGQRTLLSSTWRLHLYIHST